MIAHVAEASELSGPRRPLARSRSGLSSRRGLKRPFAWPPPMAPKSRRSSSPMELRATRTACQSGWLGTQRAPKVSACRRATTGVSSFSSRVAAVRSMKPVRPWRQGAPHARRGRCRRPDFGDVRRARTLEHRRAGAYACFAQQFRHRYAARQRQRRDGIFALRRAAHRRSRASW